MTSRTVIARFVGLGKNLLWSLSWARSLIAGMMGVRPVQLAHSRRKLGTMRRMLAASFLGKKALNVVTRASC
jgi:hypothetical protein